MIDKILIMFLFILVFVLGITLGAGAIEYDRVEKACKNNDDQIEKENRGKDVI